MFDFYPICVGKTKHVGIFTPGCFYPHMFGFWHIGMGKGTLVWKKPHNYMFANVWYFPHMCGKSHRPAYFPLSYRWQRLRQRQNIRVPIWKRFIRLVTLVTQLTFPEAFMALSVSYWNLETTSPDSPGGPGGPGGQDGQPLWSALRKYVVYMVYTIILLGRVEMLRLTNMGK